MSRSGEGGDGRAARPATGALPPIPGVHRRSCPECGSAVTLTADQSMGSEIGRFVERHETSCPHCRGTVTYTIPRGSQTPTEEDATPWGELKRRLKAIFGRGT